jgi:hypothetical protein
MLCIDQELTAMLMRLSYSAREGNFIEPEISVTRRTHLVKSRKELT